ncbi:caspase family protein [Acuticoccus sp. MNP-M23]|uniref:caspase family protein n=1 Tax=Acuticoccus sp. MNP-M23 TaxID=3072793 RepID=UPI0028160B30|nr:caspase family protein [Acuticoccus sp. MNP-M23]WMS43718.1 caspase family protein [Acuticoccus sp. MNP-M23]
MIQNSVFAGIVCSIALLMCGQPSAVAAEPPVRIALVVGNSAYAAGPVPELENPARDASLVAERLRASGFDVTLVQDAQLVRFKWAVAEFGRALRRAGPDATGLFYYAGHAVQSFGANYLLPVETDIADAADLDLVAVEANSILRQMSSARNRTNIFILDACRNNPFSAIPAFDDNGLAEMRAPTGSFLAFATAPGAVAFDGAGDNSPFTAALAEEMIEPGAPIEEVFRNVRIKVIETTGGRQTPWDTSSLTREFTFVEEAPVDPAALAEERFWASVSAQRDLAQIDLFLSAYPSGRFADAARLLRAELAPPEVAALAPDAERALNVTPAPPAAAPVIPSEPEETLLARAQESGLRADYEAYLAAYPAGVFASLARAEIAALADAAPAPPPAADAPGIEFSALPPPDVAETTDTSGEITFDSPLAAALPEIGGKSLETLIEGHPVYPPIEGLPESFWATRTCSGCHQWERANLCDQGKSYLTPERAAMLKKQHPYGGEFKQAIRTWAEQGCP